MPLLYVHLGVDLFGLWLISISLLGVFSFIGGGISASITVAAARRDGAEGTEDLSRIFVEGMILSLVAGLGFVLLAVPIVFLIDFKSIFGMSASTETEIKFLFLAILLILVTSLFSSVPRCVLHGCGLGYAGHLLDVLGILVGAAGFVAALRVDLPLWALALVLHLPSLFVVYLGGMICLVVQKVNLTSFRRSFPRRASGLHLDAISMASYQFFYSISLQTTPIIIGLCLGASAVTSFAIVHRLFSIFVMLGYVVCQAQLPMLAFAYSQNELLKSRNLLSRMRWVVPVLAGGGAIIVASSYQYIIYFWMGDVAGVDSALIVSAVIWVLIASLTNVYEANLKAKRQFAFLLRAMVGMAAVNAFLLYAFLPQFGISGAIWANSFAYLSALLVPFILRTRSSIAGPGKANA